MGRKRIRPKKKNSFTEGIVNDVSTVVDDCQLSEGRGMLCFEPLCAISERVEGREQFIHSLCHVCKGDPAQVPGQRVECGKCQLVTYCSAEHRRQHWPVHADLCNAVQAFCRDHHVDHILQVALNTSPDQFRLLRFQAMVECESRVERPLEKWEREMFIFPNVCGKCYQWNKKVLMACSKCRHSSFCEGHQTDPHHQWCPHVLRYKHIVREQHEKGLVCPTIPNCKLSTAFMKLNNMNEVFKSISNNLNEVELVELTEITTYPLTALEATRLARNGELLAFSNINLHIVGAEADFETNRLEKWEYYFLHLLPALKSLEIEFVGPELKSEFVINNFNSYKACPHCLAAGKRISFKFHNTLYHNMAERGELSKASLVCVFNPGLYRQTGYNGEDTWRETISSMFGQGNSGLVLCTAYTEREALLDVKRVRDIRPITLHVPPTLNPFASIKPALNFVSEEDSPVIFKNQFYCIMEAL